MNDGNKRQTIIGGRQCYVYECGSSDVLLVQPVDDHDLAVLDSEVSHIQAAEGFTLVAFKVNDWNTDLAPWDAPPVFGDEGFRGGAEETLRYITEELLPEFRKRGNDGASGTGIRIYLGGYSLAGLFSLWAGYRTAIFSGIAACSPSVWFPGWAEYAGSRSVMAERVYLSLGDREERTRNPVMRTVGDNIRRQLEILEDDPACEECILEMNQGNHFKEPDIRTAKGFAWLLR